MMLPFYFEVGKRLAKLSSDTKDLINAINEDDQSLFDKEGRHLKTSHSQFRHEKKTWYFAKS